MLLIKHGDLIKAVVEGDDTVRTLQWNRDVAAFAYPAGTLLYAARSQAKEGA